MMGAVFTSLVVCILCVISDYFYNVGDTNTAMYLLGVSIVIFFVFVMFCICFFFMGIMYNEQSEQNPGLLINFIDTPAIFDQSNAVIDPDMPLL
jgi:uncharacterized BrkB/YihY/UPF0761 family membrane protein